MIVKRCQAKLVELEHPLEEKTALRDMAIFIEGQCSKFRFLFAQKLILFSWLLKSEYFIHNRKFEQDLTIHFVCWSFQ